MTPRASALVFLAALLLRLGYLGLVYAGPDSLRHPDTEGYEVVAAWLAGELPEAERPTQLLALRTPGYPAYLALFRATLGSDLLWPVLGQAFLDSLSCVLIAWLAASLAPRLGLLAGLLAAANLNLITSSALALSETCFLLPLVVSLLAGVRFMARPGAGWAALAGLALGLSLLVRPVFQAFPPLLAVTLLIAARARGVAWGRALLYASLAMLTLAGVVTPRLVGNAREFGYVSLSSAAGPHLMRWTLPQARRWSQSVPAEQGQAEAMLRLQRQLAEQGLDAPPANPFEASAQQAELARRALWEIGVPGLVKAWALSTPVLLAAPSLVAVPQIAGLERPLYLRWLLLGALVTATLRLLQLAGLARIGRPDGLPWGPTLFLLGFAAYSLVVGGPYAKTVIRYRIAVEPLLVILLAAGIQWAAAALKTRRASAVGPRSAG